MYLYLIIAFVLSVISSLLVLPWVMDLCHKNGLYDMPNGRKVHVHRIPRLGGAVFVPTTAFGLVISLMLLTRNTDLIGTFKVSGMLIGLGLLSVYIIGLLDDLFGLSANLKFVIQFLSALAFPLVGLYFDNLYGLCGIYTLHPWVGYAITTFLVIFVINAVNTIDGIDGLCSGLSVIALCVYTYFFYQIHNYIFCLFSMALTGSLLVFMYYNIFGNSQKANKTFMGDSGSLMLGFSLSYLGLKLSMNNPVIATPPQGILIPLSVLVLPTFDLVRVATARMLRGVHPFHPDKTHIHHLLLFNGFGQHTALGVLLLADMLVIALNMGLWHLGLQITWIVLADILLYGLGVFFLFRNMPAHSTEQMQQTYTMQESPKTQPSKMESYVRPSFEGSDIKISIIVATYNSAATLSDTLESILSQTYQNYEVVLCDGASTDATMQVVDRYRTRFEGRMTVISEPDKGIYDAMNKGIDQATGDIIGILNSDDFYTTDEVLERIVDTFRNVPLLEAVYGDVHYVKPQNLNRPVRYYSSRWFRPRNMRMGFMPAHPSFYCIKELYSTYGKYKLEYKVAADFEQLFRLLYIHRVRAQYIDMDFVTMRTGGASNSGLKSHIQILKDHAKAIRSYGVGVSYTLFAVRYACKCVEVLWGRLRYMF